MGLDGHRVATEGRCGDPACRPILVCSLEGPALNLRSKDFLTMGDLAEHLIETYVDWPLDFVSFIVGTETFQHFNRIALRSTRLLRDLETAEVLRVTVYRLPMPDKFPYIGNEGTLVRGTCLCNFGGCCLVGREGYCHHLGQYARGGPGRCEFCGNNGCCRCDSCGDRCCAKICSEASAAEEAVRRPREGLRPGLGETQPSGSLGARED